ncbi:hypothetical protein [Catellatospora chokoriensis]|uniref:Uncharacterized protein n=1 Tax=Catellatospora chokoriensis TaxID=310353 RepID=A0A8J3JZC0_9ACTN|nr:hypothetical protein [Catellatospora chokoriensis]GIF89798.1 hypothetical protein Cch02nite_32420 [Catellatospora chokoriensis]
MINNIGVWTRPTSDIACALADVRAAVANCRQRLTVDLCDDAAGLLDAAADITDLAAVLLEVAATRADIAEPGTGEALERAAELAADSARHMTTGINLLAGATAIARSIRRRLPPTPRAHDTGRQHTRRSLLASLAFIRHAMPGMRHTDRPRADLSG